MYFNLLQISFCMGENKMTRTPNPIIDSWYHQAEKAQKFLVTAIDEHSDTVEIQYFDGTLDEIDLVSWYAMDVELVEAPEDWTGPVDMKLRRRTINLLSRD